jgi:hypothetical protein
MKTRRTEGRFLICCTTRDDMLPTGFYDLAGRIVSNENDAVLFSDLMDCSRFVERWSIPLGRENYIGFIVFRDRQG